MLDDKEGGGGGPIGVKSAAQAGERKKKKKKEDKATTAYFLFLPQCHSPTNASGNGPPAMLKELRRGRCFLRWVRVKIFKKRILNCHEKERDKKKNHLEKKKVEMK